MYIRHFLAGTVLLACMVNGTVCAQQIRQPLDFPILLSGNFGELQNNHFHSGIDLKTQGVEGKEVHAVQDGYVSRISVSPWGYGNGLYLTHPDGTTTVYGHLQKFSKKIAAYVKQQQYELENFTVNLFLSPDQLPVKKGEIVALSGNTGGSGGPHLHFEIRDTESEEILDPIEYFKDQIKDTRPPKIQAILVSPIEGKGVVNGSDRKCILKTVRSKEGKLSLSGQIEAWGEIGLAVKAYDYMDNTSNIYGVKEIILKNGEQVIYQSKVDRYGFSQTRYLNSYIDYPEWKEHRSFFTRSFVEPGNKLPFIRSINRGILTIDKPRTYHLTYILSDAFGNSTRLSIRILGKKQPVPAPDRKHTEYFRWSTSNLFKAKGIELVIPKGNLYDDLHFRYSVREDSTSLSPLHMLHDKPVPFHTGAQLSLRVQTDTLSNKQQYGIIRKDKNRRSWIGGTYRNGWVEGTIKESGTYTVGKDITPPTITPLNKANWVTRQAISFRLTDNLSGVQTYRGEIDGKYVLFEMNNKSIITYRFDKERLKRGKHRLKLTVTDLAGNQSVFSSVFTW